MIDHVDGDPWPSVRRVAFGSDERTRLFASVDRAVGGETMFGYIGGYRRAAEAVFERAAGRRHGTADYFLYPLAFLWRHHIELCLKEIIGLGRQMKGEAWGFPTHHYLDDLWAEAKPFIGHVLELENVELNIMDLAKVDPGSFGFRYSHDRKGKPSLVESPRTIDLERLQHAMVAVSNFLDAVITQFRMTLDGRHS